MLHNFQNICPIIAPYALNPYSQGDRHFILGEEETTSAESTTQCVEAAVPIHVLKQEKIARNMPRTCR